MPDPTYSISVEFVSGSFTNITSDCLRVSWNKELADSNHELSMNRLNLIVDNYTGKYSPLNSSGVYYPNLLPNKQLKVQATYNSSLHELWRGYIDSYTIDPQFASRTTNIQASDRVKNLIMQNINLLFNVDYNIGSAFTDLLSISGVVTSDRIIDTITDTVPFFWFEKQTPINAINELLKFGDYLTFIDGQGKINIKNRNINVIPSIIASITEAFNLNYFLSEDDIGNDIKVGGESRKISSIVNTIAWISGPVTIPASGWASFQLTYVDPDTNESATPAMSVTAPVPTTDYLTNTKSDGTGGWNMTAQASVYTTAFATSIVCSIYNGAEKTAYLHKFQIRGYSVQKTPRVEYEVNVTSSQNIYGKRYYSIDSNLISDIDYAKNYADYIKYNIKDPRDNIQVEVKNQWDYQLRIELGNMLWVSEPITGLQSPVVVKGIQHDISMENGLEHVVSYNVDLWIDKKWLILDNPTYGKLDDRTLGF